MLKSHYGKQYILVVETIFRLGALIEAMGCPFNIRNCEQGIGVPAVWEASGISENLISTKDNPLGGNMKKQKGFSLVELLIVIAVILLLTGISIPSLLHSRMRGNEASAVGTLRQMAAASAAYQVQCDNLGFESSLMQLGPGTGDCSSGANLLDSILGGSATPQKSGYVFTFTGDGQVPSTSFTIQADPVSSYSGLRHFFIDQTGVIRENDTSQATATDTALQ